MFDEAIERELKDIINPYKCNICEFVRSRNGMSICGLQECPCIDVPKDECPYQN